MSTREDVKTFFGLPLDFSMLELEPETGADPVRYFCTPENAEIIGWGSCGTHFVLLPGDEAVYCVEPEMAEEGTFVLPVGADFRSSFPICSTANVPVLWRKSSCWTRPGSGSFWRTTMPTPGRLRGGLQEPGRVLDLLAETFHIRSRDPFQRVKELQTGFDPSVLNFSDAYYDTLGLEKPKRGCRGRKAPV